MKTKQLSLFLIALITMVGSSLASILVNTDSTGLGIQGYDPVAYFTDGKAVRGNEQNQTSYHAVTYYFASPEHKALFLAKPAMYEPQFGGFCAYGVSKGAKVSIDPEAFQIVDGRLLLQYSKGIQKTFAKDPEGYLKKADANWPLLLKKEGK